MSSINASIDDITLQDPLDSASKPKKIRKKRQKEEEVFDFFLIKKFTINSSQLETK